MERLLEDSKTEDEINKILNVLKEVPKLTDTAQSILDLFSSLQRANPYGLIKMNQNFIMEELQLNKKQMAACKRMLLKHNILYPLPNLTDMRSVYYRLSLKYMPDNLHHEIRSQLMI